MKYISLRKFNVKQKLAKIFIQDKGAIAIITGLVIVICIGFAALAIDVGIWYSQRRQLQLSADAGAIGGAIALTKTGKSSINAHVIHDLQLNGCMNDSKCTIVAINNPPTSGPNTGNPKDVEVILSRPATLYLAGLFLSTPPTITARAVATGGSVFQNCFVALGSAGINMVGTSFLSAPSCNIYSNNNIATGGASMITANMVNAVGTASASNIVAPNGLVTGAPVLADPLASLLVPSFSGCNFTNYSGTPSNIGPGVYCGGMSLKNATVNMAPGVYIIDGGSLDLHGGTVLNGTGVTIILTSSTGNNYPSITDSGGNTLNLTAPTSGTYSGVVLYEDRLAPEGTIKFAGGTVDSINGSLYFPSQDLTFTGNSTNMGNSCVQIIAESITVNGTASAAAGLCPATLGPIALIE